MKQLTLILDNIRSAHNVGAIIRNAAAFGASDILCCGITPYPDAGAHDTRLPHIARSTTDKITKTSLGGENICSIAHFDQTHHAIDSLTPDSPLYALEMHPQAKDITNFTPSFPCALILGNEVSGIEESLILRCNEVLSIPTTSVKSSLNVASAGAIALFHFATS